MAQPSAFDVTVERTPSGATIRVRGDIDIATVARLQEAREQVVAENPEAIVIDLREVQFVDSSGLKFLLQSYALSLRAGWKLTLLRPPENVMQTFVLTGAHEQLPFAEAESPPAPPDSSSPPLGSERAVRVEIDPSVEAPRAARAVLHEVVADHPHAANHLDTLTLLVSEVVTNAVVHPVVEEEYEIGFSVAVTDELTRVVVSDGGVGFDWPAETCRADRLGGYGILLMDRQASRWGTFRAPGRFSVWFEVDHALADGDAGEQRAA
jgi:anti-anti-sigma factor